MNFYVGTSGYAYKPWKGSFYPKDLPEAGMLHFYAQRFQSVEINNSFYRLPKKSVFESWRGEVPAGFKFAVKGPQRITHFLRLANCANSVKEFLEVTSVLRRRLGPLFFQLPPNFKRDISRLEEFLRHFPRGRRVAFEFRHESWFDAETFGVLSRRNAALCIADVDPGDGVSVPFEPTANWGYVRLRRAEYTDADLKNWIDRIRKTTWQDAFVFFKHEDEGKGPKFAQRFMVLTGARIGSRKKIQV